MVSFPAGMLRKTFEVRKGSVISSAGRTQPQGKRFYLTRVKQSSRRVIREFLVSNRKISGERIDYTTNTKTSAFPFGSPVFPTSSIARRKSGRGDGRGMFCNCNVGGCIHPPLPCRASPPQGGRSHGHERLCTTGNVSDCAKTVLKADLPPCGGDARQGRGG
ncbi:hypothetical protein SAMN05443582_101456 [Phyllobacterium sp. OV277]|nr:hypothetical protein SAMN05443582_101456 [Phyllobacterium sp. OV277]